MITVNEKFRSATGSTEGWRRQYVTVATDGDAELSDVELTTETALRVPQVIRDMQGGEAALADLQLDEFIDTVAGTILITTASYAPAEMGGGVGPDRVLPEAAYEFNYQAASEHLKIALAHRRYPDSSLFDGTDFGNRINVRTDKHGNDITEGVDTPQGNTTNLYRLTVPRGWVKPAYENTVEEMMGSVNLYPFKGRPAGTMRFVQMQSSLSSKGELSMTWGFSYKPNKAYVDIEGITCDLIKGHEYWWVRDLNILDDEHEVIQILPVRVYVDQLFPEADFSALGI